MDTASVSAAAPAGARMFAPALCAGAVMHQRLQPMQHRFRYPASFLRLPVSWLDQASTGATFDGWRPPRLLGVDRANLFSVRRRDHGARDGSLLEPWARRLLIDSGLAVADGEIVLYTLPRVLGHVFNPVSFWMCHDRVGRLRAVLCEVSNTFGEHHNYLVAQEDGAPIGSGTVLRARKVFHVSPFFPVDGQYEFRFHESEARCLFRIDYSVSGVPQLSTSLSGQACPLTDLRLARAFIRLPWLMLTVLGRIHLQALRLWIKGAVYHRKPLPPVESTTR